MITAPYNFVPLNDKVVMPFWAKHVSHDIPFENAQSGILKIKISAKSPIYVRNGVSRTVPDSDNSRNEFNNVNGQYFIPGSSLKGMIRSVMEIMSYGRMKNKVNDHKYSVRDFQNNQIYNKSEISNNAKSGWLYKDGDTFYLEPCGKPGRISHKELDSLCVGKKISSHYKNATNVSDDNQKSAKSKYDIFTFSKEGHRFVKDSEDMGRIIYRIDQNSGQSGTIVLTGQPGVRKEPEGERASGKHLEFIFFDVEENRIEIPDEVIKNFFFAYYDHDRNQQKEDWRWRKNQLNRGERIPVFYRSNSNGQIIDMGLTQLYKITYKNSVVDLIKSHQKESGSYDLAETIFGFTEDKKALKGRVHFGHAFVDEDVDPLEIKTEVLAGPKASYYPNYIDQNQNNKGKVSGNYNTYMDKTAKIKGWKRYPVRTGGNYISNPGTPNVSTHLIPLPANTSFSFNISYHNLRKEELGALISALTFHNTEGLFHSIGSAKPLGYGKIVLKIKNLDESKKLEMLKAYELFMDCELKHSTPLWFQSVQIKELMAMAKPGNDDAHLNYMPLSNFVNAKGRRKDDPKYSLPRYSKITNNNVFVNSLISEIELHNSIKEYNKEKALFENQEDILVIQDRIIKQNKRLLKGCIEQKKQSLLKRLNEKRLELLDEERTLKAEKEAEKRAIRRAEQQKDAISEGLDFKTIDFEINLRKLEDQVAKRIVDYAKKIHNCNDKELNKIPIFLLNLDDIKKTKDAITKIYHKLPEKEKTKKKMKFRINRWEKWIGKKEVTSLSL